MVSGAREIPFRVRRLTELLGVSGLNGALITARSDVRYFSGFTGDDSCLLITPGKKYLVTDGRYVEEAENSTVGYEIVTWKEHPAVFAADLFSNDSGRKLGVCANNLTVNWYKKLGAAGINMAPLDSVIARIREEKSEWEIEQIMTSLRAVEAAFREFNKMIKIGMSEKELKLELEYCMYAQGVENPSFDTIVAAGANSSLPHAHAGDRRIAAGSILLIDFGGVINGYCSDLTRTLFIAEISAEWQERYELVLAAQKAGIEAVHHGVELRNIDRAAREVFVEAGVAEYFVHSLGHGVGLDVHELPRLSSVALGKMPIGAVCTVEPGLYFPGEGGIRIEDMVVAGRNGTIVLSTLEKDLGTMVVPG